MKNLAIIPARSGSKGLPDKNIKLLSGKPLFAYSIEAAKESGLFEEILVSTDSAEYAQIAKEWGADVPFLRSSETSTDSASSWDAVKEAVTNYRRLGKEFDTITLLQPTSPLRMAQDIEEGYRLLEEKEARAVVSVCETDHSPLWSNTLPEDHSMAGFIRDEVKNRPRQELPSYYRINGALYILRTKVLEDIAGLYGPGCYAYVMPKERSVDIDTALDFKIAEILFSKE